MEKKNTTYIGVKAEIEKFKRIAHAISITSIGLKKYLLLAFILISTTLSFTSCDQYMQYDLQRSEDSYWRTYTWIFHRHTYQITLIIPVATYEHYSILTLTLPVQFNSFATEDPEFPYLAAIDSELYDLVKNEHLNEYELCDYFLSFVQSIQYACHADIFFDCPKSPVVTLMRGFKDCKDGSVLFSALISTMGVKARLIFLPGHVAVGVAGLPNAQSFFVSDGTAYAFAETTDPSFSLSEVPDGIWPEQIQFTLPVKRTAFFYHRGTIGGSTISGSHGVAQNIKNGMMSE